VAKKRGLHDLYLEQAELTKNTKKWDWSVGRISEPMGVTGYWFGKEYNGVCVVYTDQKTQVSLGYGDFSQTTDITDSAYNHKERTMIYRAPTLAELMGLMTGKIDGYTNYKGIYPGLSYDPNGQYNYREKFNHAQTPEEKIAVMKEFLKIVKTINDTAIKEYPGYAGFWYSDPKEAVDMSVVACVHNALPRALDIVVKTTGSDDKKDLKSIYTFYHWLRYPKNNREIENESIATEIRNIHEQHPDMGYRRIRDELDRYEEIHVNDKKVLRICRKYDIKSNMKWKPKSCTRGERNPDHIAKNYQHREFDADKPNEKWLTDVSEFK
jgi:hypothetical protein